MINAKLLVEVFEPIRNSKHELSRSSSKERGLIPKLRVFLRQQLFCKILLSNWMKPHFLNRMTLLKNVWSSDQLSSPRSENYELDNNSQKSEQPNEKQSRRGRDPLRISEECWNWRNVFTSHRRASEHTTSNLEERRNVKLCSARGISLYIFIH